MTDAPGDDEQMPDRVVEGDAVDRVEDDAEGVKEPAGQQPADPGEGDHGQQPFEVDDDHPPQSDIEDRGQKCQSLGHERFEDDSGQRQGPDGPEEQPAVPRAQRHQGERGVATGDNQEDPGVVENPEEVADLRGADRMVEGRDHVEEAQGAAEDGGADDPVGIAGPAGGDDHHHQADQAHERRNAVGQAVRQFLAFAVDGQVNVFFHCRACVILLSA